IVDYIDEDEISTPFNFYTTADGLPAANLGDATTSPPNPKDPTPNPDKFPKDWVFGTERPPVALNQVMADDNRPPKDPATGTYVAPNNTSPVKVWAELFSPYGKPAPNGTLQAQDGTPIPLFVTNPTTGAVDYGIYKVVIANSSTNPDALAPSKENVLGR